MMELMENSIISIIAAGFGSVGYGIFFRMKTKQLFWAWVGGTFTWIVYLLVYYCFGGCFIPNFIASIFAAFFAERMAIINRAPATIFLIEAVIPLIPGGPLYYTMAGIVTKNDLLMSTSGNKALTVALAISLGFMVVAVLHRYFRIIKSTTRKQHII